jgi:hypothetical protein
MWNVVKWGELSWFMWHDFIWNWSEVNYGEVLVDKGAMYIGWLYTVGIDYIVAISFGYILHCVCFNFYCGGFILFVMGVCVCVCFVICGCFVNMYSDWSFLTLTEIFPCFLLSCKANARVKFAKTGHGPHSSTLVVICFVLCIVCV